jgi:TRAF3-interacting protein 1
MPTDSGAVAKALGKLISKPKLSDKYLNRPPFRFLHDIFTNVAKETGFGRGLIASAEVDGKAIEGKAAKVAFLSKWILCVGIAMRRPLDVNPLKVVAGRDVEKTLQFLADLATCAADSSLDQADLVRRTLAGEEPGAAAGGGGKGASKEASPPPRERSRKRSGDSKTSDSPAAAKVAEAGPSTSRSRRGGRGAAAVPPIDLSSRGEGSVDDADGTVEATMRAVSALIKKPKMTEALLKRPPFKFIQDIVMAVVAETKFCARQFRPWRAKISEKEKKKEFVKLVAKCVGDALGLAVEISASKLIAGKECEKTRRLLHLLTIAAAKPARGSGGGKSKSGGAASSADSSSGRSSGGGSRAAPAKQRSADPSRPEVVRSLPSQQSKQPIIGSGIDEPVVGIMKEGESEDSDDDAPLGGEESDEGPGGRGGGAASKTGRSKFVRDQEEAAARKKKASASGSKTGEGGDGTGRKGGRKASGIQLGRLKRSYGDGDDGGRSKNGPVDTDELMETVQKLCHSSVPLGKCMDCVQEDMEMMRRELAEWQELHAQKSKEVAVEQERADRDLEPLRKRLEDVETQIGEQRNLIDSQKTIVAQNEARLNRLLKSFVQGG